MMAAIVPPTKPPRVGGLPPILTPETVADEVVGGRNRAPCTHEPAGRAGLAAKWGSGGRAFESLRPDHSSEHETAPPDHPGGAFLWACIPVCTPISLMRPRGLDRGSSPSGLEFVPGVLEVGHGVDGIGSAPRIREGPMHQGSRCVRAPSPIAQGSGRATGRLPARVESPQPAVRAGPYGGGSNP